MIRKPLHIVKVGGKVVEKPESLHYFLQRFSSIPGLKILVHGGGVLATELAEKMGIEVKMHEGRRITDSQSLQIAVMVYAGWINKNIVSKLQSLQVNALGLTGADLNVIQSVKRPVKTIDYGWVADIEKVDAKILQGLLVQEIVPVFAAITHNREGQLLNTNADTIASALAVALSAVFETTLWYCFEKKGVLMDASQDDSFIQILEEKEFIHLKEQKIIHSGMIPKLENSFDALRKGVDKVYILHENALASDPVEGTLLKL